MTAGDRLLTWYDRHARDLPWRVGPHERRRGVSPDPYAVWLSEVMLQQTTVAAVRGYFTRFMALWPDVRALAAADDAQVMGEWAGLGYYARARNLVKCARVVADDLNGVFPSDRAALQALPGIGPYTSAAIAAIAFDRPETVVDGNVERVVARLFSVETPLPGAKPDLARLAASLTPVKRPGDHAQAMMDLGATICTAKSPRCAACPLAHDCAGHAAGRAGDLPRRAPRSARPVRRGTMWLARRDDGAWLMERRPPRGLLGGMLGWPGAGWEPDQPTHAPLAADWHDPGVEIRHTFTHFHAVLSLKVAVVGMAAQPLRGDFMIADRFDPNALPTLMRKAHAAAVTALN